MHEEDLAAFYDHQAILVEIMRREELLYETLMLEGTAAIFDNHRVLHGRRSFTGLTRSLLGCYVGKDDLLNLKRVMDEKRSRPASR